MKKLKERFENDPVFAVAVIAVGAIVLTKVLTATAKTVETSLAYRAAATL